MFIILALISALLASVRRAGEKHYSHKLNHFTIGWVVQLFSLPLVTAALLLWGEWHNPFELGYDFWLPVLFLWFVFYPLNNFWYITAVKIGEMSKVMPLQSLGPVLALLLGCLLLHERPSVLGLAGIATIVVGVYVLNLKGRYLHNPLAIFSADKANLYTISFLMLGTFVGVLDKIAMEASEPIYFSFVSTVGAVIVLWLSSVLFKVKEYREVKRHIVPLGALGMLFGGSFMAYCLALSMGPLATVNTLRSTSLLVGTAIGVLYFKEKFTRPKKYSLILIIIGVVLLAIP